MYHYCYRITNLIEYKHYYGVRSSKISPELDLGINYFSSSSNKEFIIEQKTTTNYKYKIIRLFDTRKEAIQFEIKLHNRLNVHINESFYNKAKQTSTGFDTQGILGKRLSLCTKQLISEKVKIAHKIDPSIGIRKSESLKKFFKNKLNRSILSEKVKIAHKIDPSIGIRKSESAKRKKYTCSYIMKNGVFCTPYSNYITLSSIVDVSNEISMSHTTVRNWCRNPDIKIVIQSVLNNRFLCTSDLGKTRRELGFYMIYPKTEKEAKRLLEEFHYGEIR